MANYRDLDEMIGVLTTAIAIHEREEMFFRRSARLSTSEQAKSLFAEIADELRSHVKLLEAKKETLTEELEKLKT